MSTPCACPAGLCRIAWRRCALIMRRIVAVWPYGLPAPTAHRRRRSRTTPAPIARRCSRTARRKEGALTIYTTGTQIAPLVDRFKQKYPYRASPDAAGVLDRRGDQGDAGICRRRIPRRRLRTQFGRPHPAARPGRPAAVHVAASAEYRGRTPSKPAAIGSACARATPASASTPQKIPPAQAPKTYQDLLDPEMEGQDGDLGDDRDCRQLGRCDGRRPMGRTSCACSASRTSGSIRSPAARSRT